LGLLLLQSFHLDLLFVLLALLDQEQIFFLQVFEDVHQLGVSLEKHFVVIFSVINYVSQLLRNVQIVFNFTQVVIIILNSLSVVTKLGTLLVSRDFIVHLLLILLLSELRLSLLLGQRLLLLNFF
jgi:hypothetical protein